MAVSIVAEGDPDLDFALAPRGRGIEACGWALVAVDLVHAGEDPDAGVTSWRGELTDAERKTQQRLDRFLADESAPLGVDLLDRAREVGVAALKPVGDIVAPLLASAVS